MPRAVRNFWVEVYVDGRKTNIGTGPRCKGGGMMIEVFQRDRGCIKKACTLYCTSDQGENLTTELVDHTINDATTPILRTVR
jgi:hypothetical protein